MHAGQSSISKASISHLCISEFHQSRTRGHMKLFRRLPTRSSTRRPASYPQRDSNSLSQVHEQSVPPPEHSLHKSTTERILLGIHTCTSRARNLPRAETFIIVRRAYLMRIHKNIVVGKPSVIAEMHAPSSVDCVGKPDIVSLLHIQRP